MGYEPGRVESVERNQSGPGTRAVPEPSSAADPPAASSAATSSVVSPVAPAPESGPDRMAVHVVWEFVLAGVVGALGLLLWLQEPQILRGNGLRELLVDTVALGLLALAAGLSLRTAAPNLAIGPVAVAAAVHFAEQGDRGLAESVGPALVVAAVGGLVLALFVVVLHVPAWAASLAAVAALVGYIERRSGPVLVQSDYDPRISAYHLFAGLLAVAVLGGIFGAIRSVRGVVGRFRPLEDPARRRGVLAAVVTAGGLVVSTVLAVLAGVLIAANGPDRVVPESGLDWTALGFGMALLGGTSAFGRRGGVSGTVLVVVLVSFLFAYAEAAGPQISRWAVAGVTLAAGLVVTRLVETYGRPRPATDDTFDSGPGGDPIISSGWILSGSDSYGGSWPPALPTPSAREDPADPWSRWSGDRDRWSGDRDRWSGDRDRWSGSASESV